MEWSQNREQLAALMKLREDSITSMPTESLNPTLTTPQSKSPLQQKNVVSTNQPTDQASVTIPGTGSQSHLEYHTSTDENDTLDNFSLSFIHPRGSRIPGQNIWTRYSDWFD